jgi:hypothetical protein
VHEQDDALGVGRLGLALVPQEELHVALLGGPVLGAGEAVRGGRLGDIVHGSGLSLILFAHVLIGEPATTSPEHALARSAARHWKTSLNLRFTRPASFSTAS